MCSKVQPDVACRAASILSKYKSGEIHCRKLSCFKSVFVLDVGYRHRLLSVNRVDWELVTHERYNKLVSSKKRRKYF